MLTGEDLDVEFKEAGGRGVGCGKSGLMMVWAEGKARCQMWFGVDCFQTRGSPDLAPEALESLLSCGSSVPPLLVKSVPSRSVGVRLLDVCEAQNLLE